MRSAWPSPSLTVTRRSTGSLRTLVRTVLPLTVISRGRERCGSVYRERDDNHRRHTGRWAKPPWNRARAPGGRFIQSMSRRPPRHRWRRSGRIRRSNATGGIASTPTDTVTLLMVRLSVLTRFPIERTSGSYAQGETNDTSAQAQTILTERIWDSQGHTRPDTVSSLACTRWAMCRRVPASSSAHRVMASRCRSASPRTPSSAGSESRAPARSTRRTAPGRSPGRSRQ